jgi:hypothetical protein
LLVGRSLHSFEPFLEIDYLVVAMTHQTTQDVHKKWEPLFESLPGGELIREGLRDLQNQHETVPALLVLIGSPRLRMLGLPVPEPTGHVEHRLYDLLESEDENSAHSRYNALRRTLVSFARAAECVIK